MLVTLGACSGAQRFIVAGPVEYTGRRVGTFKVGEGGRIAYGYTPAEFKLLADEGVKFPKVLDGAGPVGRADIAD